MAILALQLHAFQDMLAERHRVSRQQLPQYFAGFSRFIGRYAVPDVPQDYLDQTIARFRGVLEEQPLHWPPAFAALISANPKDPELLINLVFLYEEIVNSSREISRIALEGSVAIPMPKVSLF